MRPISNIPHDTTVSNRTISEAVRALLSDCYIHLFDKYETAFLHRLLHAPPNYELSDDQGLLLNRLLRRAAHSVRASDPSLRRNSRRVGRR